MNIARLVLCLAVLLPGPALAAGGYYTAEQAAAGRADFISNCAGCHGFNLQGMGAPTLKGRNFLAAYGTAAGLYGFFSKAMPATYPGSLSAETYTELLAYLMSANGIPAGTQPLADTDGARAAIDLVKAAGLADTASATPQ